MTRTPTEDGMLFRPPGRWVALAGALALGACVSTGERVATGALPPVPKPEAVATAPVTSGNTIGTGAVKVGLLLPLTGQGQAAIAATSLRNAAELAYAEFDNPDLTILVKDDRGTPDGAREAGSQALAEGAELLIGPLFAGSVQATAQIAREKGRPVLAFSSDATVAGRGVYLLSFLPQSEVDRAVTYATGQGRRSFAALVPDGAYGGVVEAEFREAAARRGARVVAVERYAPGQGEAAVGKLAGLVTGSAPQADALFLPENPEALPAVADALTRAGFNPQRVKPVGTGVWNDPRALRLAALQGGWFAAPDPGGYNSFSERYRAKYGSDPARIATLSYDAVSLAAALARTQGSQRFAEGVLTSPAGFAGADGTFRFKADGTNERGLAVMEVRDGAASPVSGPRKALSASGT